MPHRAPRTNTATTGHITLAGPVAKRADSDPANASGKAGPAPGIPPGVAYTPTTGAMAVAGTTVGFRHTATTRAWAC